MVLKNITKCSPSSKLMEFLWICSCFCHFCPSMQMSLTQVLSPTLPGLPTCPLSWTWRSLPEVDVECPAWRVPVLEKSLRSQQDESIIYCIYVHTHTCIASYCSSSNSNNNNNNNNNSSNVTLFSRVWWLYPYRWKSKSFSHQFQSYLICLKTTLVLRDKNIPNAPKFEPFSWKNIYIYKASCQVRIENGFKTPTINPLVETEPGLLVPPHPHPCHLPPVLGWKNAFLSALPWLQWSLELPGGVISMEF